MQKIILLLFFILGTLTLSGQTFKLGLISGLNMSKLGGDDKNSYNYLGFKCGGRVGVDLFHRLRTSIDLLYSRKGNIVSHNRSSAEVFKNVVLDYMEIPFFISYMDWMDDPDEEKYHRLHFTIGVAYSRLINYKARDNQDFDVTNEQDFNKDKWSVRGGLVYYPNEHLGINLEYSQSLSGLEKANTLPAMRMQNWSINFIYMLNNKKLKKSN